MGNGVPPSKQTHHPICEVSGVTTESRFVHSELTQPLCGTSTNLPLELRQTNDDGGGEMFGEM